MAFRDPWGLCPEPPCRVTDWSALHDHVIPKHVEGTRGPASQFVDTDEKALRHAIEATIERADFVSTEEVAGELRHTFERRWNGSIGSKGEQMMRVVISDAGELRTAFPVRGPKAGATKLLGRGMSGAVRKAGRVLGPVLGVVGIALELTLGATPAY